MASFEVFVKTRSLPWLGAYKNFIKEIVEKEGLEDKGFSLTLCDDPYIKELNSLYRQEDRPTDVLSFCQGEGEEFPKGGENSSIGDIILSLESIERNSNTFGVTFEEELKRTTIHGILHLKGMTHQTREPGDEMLRYQEELLAQMREVKVI